MIIKGTSCYENAKSGNLVSITGDGGNAWGFYGNAYKKMSPRLYLWQYYDQNPDNLTEDELINTLNQKFGEEIILLCHELPGTEINKTHFCHRRLLADWLELETGIIIPELSISQSGIITAEEIYDLKPKIKNLIKKY